LLRLKVERLSKDREAPPVWLWSSKTGAAPADVDLWWQVFLRRFDLEHTFRFAKQTLGWTTPRVRTPEAADRWTWLVVIAHTQLRLARPMAADLRRPWEKPAKPERLIPARVRRGSGTSAPTCSARPVFPNPAAPAPDAHPAPRTAIPHPATTSVKPRQTPRDPQGHRQTRPILVDREQVKSVPSPRHAEPMKGRENKWADSRP
jgi:hypothetical protein